jgi:hypothetical protein
MHQPPFQTTNPPLHLEHSFYNNKFNSLQWWLNENWENSNIRRKMSYAVKIGFARYLFSEGRVFRWRRSGEWKRASVVFRQEWIGTFFLLLFFLLFKPGLRVTWVRVNSGPVVVDRFYICIGLDGYLDNPCILIVKWQLLFASPRHRVP